MFYFLPLSDASFELKQVHSYKPKCTESQPCDWLIRDEVEQVYLTKWSIRVCMYTSVKTTVVKRSFEMEILYIWQLSAYTEFKCRKRSSVTSTEQRSCQ